MLLVARDVIVIWKDFAPISVIRLTAFAQNCFIFLFSCMFILLSRESDQSAVTSSRRSCRPPVYYNKMGNLAKCLSQRHNK